MTANAKHRKKKLAFSSRRYKMDCKTGGQEKMMSDKIFRCKTFLTLVLVWTFLMNSLPVKAQIDLDSGGLLAGSSAFVFRKSSGAPQRKTVSQRSSNASRTKKQRTIARTRIVKQSNTVARERQQKRGVKQIDSATFAAYQPKFKTMQNSEASLIFTGAGEYYLGQENLPESERFFRGAIDLDAKSNLAKAGLSDVLTRRGNALLEADKTDFAKLAFEEAVKNDSKNAAAYAGLGEVFDSSDNNKSAIENYEKALSLDSNLTEIYPPLGILYYQEGNIAQAQKYLEKALAADADNAETQYFLGMVRFKQNDNAKALTALKRSAELEPANAETFYYLGQVYDRLGDKEKSLAAYQKAVELDDKFAEGWFDLAVAYYNAGNEAKNGKDYFLKAENAYQKAKQLSNNETKRRLNIDSYVNLADVYRQLAALETTIDGKRNYYSKAVGEYRLATTFIERKPELFDASEKDGIAEIYSDYGFVAGQAELNKKPTIPKTWTTTIDALKKAAEISPNAIDNTNLGWAYFNAGQDANRLQKPADALNYYRQGKDVLQKALQEDQKFVAALLNLGMINNELKDFRGAIDPLEKALDLSNDKAVKIIANNELGIAYRQQNDYDKAAKSFQRVLDANPNFASAVYNLGETEYQRKNKKEAEKMLEKLRQLGSNYYYARLKGILAGAVLR